MNKSGQKRQRIGMFSLSLSCLFILLVFRWFNKYVARTLARAESRQQAHQYAERDDSPAAREPTTYKKVNHSRGSACMSCIQAICILHTHFLHCRTKKKHGWLKRTDWYTSCRYFGFCSADALHHLHFFRKSEHNWKKSKNKVNKKWTNWRKISAVHWFNASMFKLKSPDWRYCFATVCYAICLNCFLPRLRFWQCKKLQSTFLPSAEEDCVKPGIASSLVR